MYVERLPSFPKRTFIVDNEVKVSLEQQCIADLFTIMIHLVSKGSDKSS